MTPVSPSPSSATQRTRPDAAERILRSAVRCIVASGANDLTLHQVAEEAGVSKGLIHYHFHDKDTVLARVVEWMTHGMVLRERAALAESTPRHAIDDLWTWNSGELERGHVRVLIQLSEWRGSLVQRAVRASLAARRKAAAESAERLFNLLGLRPRVPAPLLASVIVAFMDGLAISLSSDAEQNSRAAFDVFWLSLLSIAE